MPFSAIQLVIDAKIRAEKTYFFSFEHNCLVKFGYCLKSLPNVETEEPSVLC